MARAERFLPPHADDLAAVRAAVFGKGQIPSPTAAVRAAVDALDPPEGRQRPEFRDGRRALAAVAALTWHLSARPDQWRLEELRKLEFPDDGDHHLPHHPFRFAAMASHLSAFLEARMRGGEPLEAECLSVLEFLLEQADLQRAEAPPHSPVYSPAYPYSGRPKWFDDLGAGPRQRLAALQAYAAVHHELHALRERTRAAGLVAGAAALEDGAIRDGLMASLCQMLAPQEPRPPGA